MKLIEVLTQHHICEQIQQAAQELGAVDSWLGSLNADGRQAVRILVAPEQRQQVLDGLQGVLGDGDDSRILVYPVEISLPRPASSRESLISNIGITREELYNQVVHGARLNLNFILLVFLSTIVASIGLLEDNTAVVIGAMVIAPLLGPNIALALGTALGDTALMWSALKTNIAGVGLAWLLALLIGLFWPLDTLSGELLSRTDVGGAGVALALASGAAAALSLSTGLSSVLVGVMVAVALLPPTATLGLMIGSGHWNLALGALLLLTVNIVCVNLSAKLVFLFRGIKPHAWIDEARARQSMTVYILLWIGLLAVLLAVIAYRHYLYG